MQSISEWLRPYLSPISMAIVATLLVVYGNDLNRAVRKMIRKYHFFVRLSILILVCAFGYGLLTVMAAKLLADILGSISNHYLALVLAAIFALLGMAADQNHQM